MKLAFSTLGCPKWTWEQILSAAVKFGYQGIELRFIGDSRDLLQTPEFLPENLQNTISDLQRHNLEICCVDASTRVLLSDAAELNVAKELMSLSAKLNSRFIRVFPGQPPHGAPLNDFLSKAVQNLKELGDFGEKCNVHALIETHDSMVESRVVAEIVEKVNHPFVGVLWDIHHPFRLAGESPLASWNHFGARVKHVHVKDSRKTGEKFQYVLCGEGDVPIHESLQILKNNGYTGWISVEWEKLWHPAIPDPEIALSQYAVQLKKMLARLN